MTQAKQAHPCEMCGDGPLKRRGTRGPWPRFCQQCSRERTRRAIRRWGRTRPDRERAPDTLTCDQCEVTFSYAGTGQPAKYCSESCKRRHDYLKHRDERLAKAEAYREANRETLRRRQFEYARRNPKKVRANQRKHDARRRAIKQLGPGVTVADWEAIVRWYRGECAYCDNEATTQDHVIPLSRGGRHAPGNVVPACAPCNRDKHDKFLAEWRYGT